MIELCAQHDSHDLSYTTQIQVAWATFNASSQPNWLELHSPHSSTRERTASTLLLYIDLYQFRSVWYTAFSPMLIQSMWTCFVFESLFFCCFHSNFVVKKSVWRMEQEKRTLVRIFASLLESSFVRTVFNVEFENLEKRLIQSTNVRL